MATPRCPAVIVIILDRLHGRASFQLSSRQQALLEANPPTFLTNNIRQPLLFQPPCDAPGFGSSMLAPSLIFSPTARAPGPFPTEPDAISFCFNARSILYQASQLVRKGQSTVLLAPSATRPPHPPSILPLALKPELQIVSLPNPP
jgi:hypothetical protein